METKGKNGVLRIYVGESDRLNGKALFEEIVFEARKLKIAGATVYKGIMSYGASHSMHTLKMFALSSDMPVIIEIIDDFDKLKDFAKHVNSLLDKGKKGGLITLQKIDVIRYEKGEKYKFQD